MKCSFLRGSIFVVPALSLALAGCHSSLGKSRSESSKTLSEKPVSESVVVSPEKRAVDAAVARAEKSGKAVLLKVSAAWCPPCLNLTRLMNENKDQARFKAAFSGFEYVELEEQYFLNTSIAEFLPFDVQKYPSFVLYHPANKTWSTLYVEGAIDRLSEALEAFIKDQSAIPSSLARLEAAVVENDPDSLSALESLPHAFALELGRAEAEARLQELLQWVSRNSEVLKTLGKQPEVLSSRAKKAFYNTLRSSGKISTRELEETLGEELRALRSEELGPLYLTAYLFTSPLAEVVRTRDLHSAATECNSLRVDFDLRYAPVPVVVPEDATAELRAKLLKQNEEMWNNSERGALWRETTCALLDSRSGGESGRAKAREFLGRFSDDDLFATKKSDLQAHALARIWAHVGDFARAATVEAKYLEVYLSDSKNALAAYDERISAMETSLAEAQQAGDAEKTVELERKLKSERYRREGKVLTEEAMSTVVGRLIQAYKAGSVHPYLK